MKTISLKLIILFLFLGLYSVAQEISIQETKEYQESKEEDKKHFWGVSL